MSLAAFLYRRVSRWVTCEIGLPSGTKLPLASKYDVASFSDVFCHPFYWQIYQWLESPVPLVVDCGAHCGHFSILVEQCCISKFGRSQAEYLAIEPNPHLLPRLERNLRRAGLGARFKIVQALLGSDTPAGVGQLWVQSKNYLSASVYHAPGGKQYQIPTTKLSSAIGPRPVDILKVDIEGAEYDLVAGESDVFASASLVIMEVHAARRERRNQMLKTLEDGGLYPVLDPIVSCGNELFLFKNAKRAVVVKQMPPSQSSFVAPDCIES